MNLSLTLKPLTAVEFAPFGDVLECTGEPDKMINEGRCGRFHDRAHLDFGTDGAAGISLFRAELCDMPHELRLVERHPEGSQAFVPMSMDPFLVIVATDRNGAPDTFHAFITTPGQGVNFYANTWHGVLTPLSGPGLFAVIDRIGNTPNLEEYWLEESILITP